VNTEIVEKELGVSLYLRCFLTVSRYGEPYWSTRSVECVLIKGLSLPVKDGGHLFKNAEVHLKIINCPQRGCPCSYSNPLDTCEAGIGG